MIYKTRIKSRIPSFFERIIKTDQFILDDFGMKRLNTEQVLDLMEIIKERHGRQATVIVSQVPVSGGTRPLRATPQQLTRYSTESSTQQQDLIFVAKVSEKILNFAQSKL